MDYTAQTASLENVLQHIADERARQDAKWGSQRDHSDGTGLDPVSDKIRADLARQACDDSHKAGKDTWRDILTEEVFEAYAESDPIKLREELVQVSAVAVCWIEAIDARLSNTNQNNPILPGAENVMVSK